MTALRPPVSHDRVDLGGTVRAAGPEETLRRLRPLLRPLGITRLAHITGLDHLGIPVCVAVRPLGKLASNAQGKGLTEALAEISAIGECLEAWHGENLPPPVRVASYRALLGEGAAPRPVAPWTLRPAVADGRLGEDSVLPWLLSEELLGGAPVLLPRARFDLDTTSPAAEAAGLLYHVTTNGLAAGNTRAEALVQGLCEVIERDARARYDRLGPAERASRRVDLASIDEAPACGHVRDLLARLRRAGLQVEVFDITSPIPVPAFLALIHEPDAPGRSFVDEGMGAHLRPEIALSRALLEAAQSRLAYISGSRDDLEPEGYRAQLARAVRPVSGPAVQQSGGRRFAACLRPPEVDSFDAELRWLLDSLRGHTRVFALDHTRPELGVPVVHVLCPELLSSVG